MGSQFGTLFSIATFGESHGGALGVVIEGCPPGIELDADRIQQELDRRRPGQSSLTTPRKEADQCEVLSGMFEGKTLGSPIAIIVKNSDADPNAYKDFKEQYRPSHGDYTTQQKYGIRAWAGGGRASARETVARVAAGAVARQVLESLGSVEVIAWVDRLGDIQSHVSENTVQRKDVDQNDVRCPDQDAGEKMEARIKQVQAAGDTVGGVIRCIARHVPAGLGDPVFDKLEADLAKAMLSLPASKGFEIGSGFSGTTLLGSEHNDVFITDESGEVRTRTNRSGGIQGGISNGMPIHCAVAFKPVSTIFQTQETVNEQGEKTTIHPKGRHDPCVLPRAVPIVEAMMCLVLVDHWLRWRGQVGE